MRGWEKLATALETIRKYRFQAACAKEKKAARFSPFASMPLIAAYFMLLCVHRQAKCPKASAAPHSPATVEKRVKYPVFFSTSENIFALV